MSGLLLFLLLFFFVDNLMCGNNWPVVGHTTLTPSSYSEYIINDDIINSLNTINLDTGFGFLHYTNFSTHFITNIIFTYPYNARGNMHIIDGDITMYINTRYV